MRATAVVMAWMALASLASAAQAGVIRGTVSPPRKGAKGTVTDAVVYIDPLPDELELKWGARGETFTVVQRERRFIPRVSAVPVGSTIRFQNRDDVYHNVFSVSPAKRFDLGKYPPNATNQVTFTRPGVVNLFCDIHPKMAAWVVVVAHRLYVRPEGDGTFAFPKLPPGPYRLVAWHPSFGRLTKKVDLPRHGDATVALHF
jgi:plastocyanin